MRSNDKDSTKDLLKTTVEKWWIVTQMFRTTFSPLSRLTVLPFILGWSRLHVWCLSRHFLLKNRTVFFPNHVWIATWTPSVRGNRCHDRWGTEICSGATVPQLVDLKGIQLNAMMAKAGEKQAHHQPKGGMMKGHGCKWEMLGFSLFYKLNLEVASAVGHHQRWEGDDLDVSSCWQHWDPLAPFFFCQDR